MYGMIEAAEKCVYNIYNLDVCVKYTLLAASCSQRVACDNVNPK